MADFIELEIFGRRTLERMSNILSITEKIDGSTRVTVSSKFSDGTDWYDVDNSYDEVKEKLMRGETNG